MSNLLVDGVVVAAVLATFALARKYLPAAPLPNRKLSILELDSEFSTTNIYVYIAMVGIGILFVWATHRLLVSANHYLAFSDGSYAIHLLPQTAIWWFFPGFGALALSWEITLQLWALLGKRERVELFNSWSNRRAGFDSRRILRWMALLIAMPIGVATILAIPMHATLSLTEIQDCGYGFTVCKIYRYSDAKRLTKVDGFRDRDGKLTARAGVVVDFSNGGRWSSANWGDFKSDVDPALEQLLIRQTGLLLNNANTEADIPANAPVRH